jgi:hypothetical protein
MQGREDAQRGCLDVEALVGELLAPGSVFAFFGQSSGVVVSGFDDGGSVSLLAGPAFGSGAGGRLGAGVAGQALQGLSDRETAEALTFDLRWKAAWGYGLTDTAFHPSMLAYWSRRFAASGNPHRSWRPSLRSLLRPGR